MNWFTQMLKAIDENFFAAFIVFFSLITVIIIVGGYITRVWESYHEKKTKRAKEKTKQALINSGRMDEYLKLEAKDKN